MATIIVALVAAVLVIIGLVAFNVRHASIEKKEINEDVPNQPDVPRSESEVAARPVEPEEEASTPSQTDERVSGDDFYRQALQKFKQPEPPVKEEEPETKMNDDMYRSALQKLKQNDK
ncbi:hypothetical protein [Bacillus pumilus]|uniref:hypothetical protein n=1 Tax=Bacillus pumilus TaxID=1408 RepID=UPI000D045D53|nr:hypothetical protein [Bacillus pumilus]PRS29599.1 hypothetical protein C6X99_00225 [Bacillus pumilus]